MRLVGNRGRVYLEIVAVGMGFIYENREFITIYEYAWDGEHGCTTLDGVKRMFKDLKQEMPELRLKGSLPSVTMH